MKSTLILLVFTTTSVASVLGKKQSSPKPERNYDAEDVTPSFQPGRYNIYEMSERDELNPQTTKSFVPEKGRARGSGSGWERDTQKPSAATVFTEYDMLLSKNGRGDRGTNLGRVPEHPAPQPTDYAVETLSTTQRSSTFSTKSGKSPTDRPRAEDVRSAKKPNGDKSTPAHGKGKTGKASTDRPSPGRDNPTDTPNVDNPLPTPGDSLTAETSGPTTPESKEFSEKPQAYSPTPPTPETTVKPEVNSPSPPTPEPTVKPEVNSPAPPTPEPTVKPEANSPAPPTPEPTVKPEVNSPAPPTPEPTVKTEANSPAPPTPEPTVKPKADSHVPPTYEPDTTTENPAQEWVTTISSQFTSEFTTSLHLGQNSIPNPSEGDRSASEPHSNGSAVGKDSVAEKPEVHVDGLLAGPDGGNSSGKAENIRQEIGEHSAPEKLQHDSHTSEVAESNSTTNLQKDLANSGKENATKPDSNQEHANMSLQSRSLKLTTLPPKISQVPTNPPPKMLLTKTLQVTTKSPPKAPPTKKLQVTTKSPPKAPSTRKLQVTTNSPPKTPPLKTVHVTTKVPPKTTLPHKPLKFTTKPPPKPTLPPKHLKATTQPVKKTHH